MKKSCVFLLVFILVVLALPSCLAGSYSAVCPIPYAGVADNRGIAVNKNPGSPYYGYFYGVSSSLAAVAIWRPESGGTNATSYVDTGQTLSYEIKPAGCLLMHAFVGPDDTVWVADYGAKQICVGPPGGGYLTAVIDSSLLTYKPRSIYVTGNYGQAGTRVYVAEYESSTARNCEVFEFDGSSWSRIASLGHLGLAQPWFVTVDSAGNSYWANVTSAAPYVKKVKPDFTEDTSWSFTKPSFMATGWSPRGIAYVHNPNDPQYPDVLYISGYNNTSCIRCDMNGNYIDGYGNTSGMTGTPPAGTWTSFALSGPGGNQTVWIAADDVGNTYLAVKYPGTVTQVYKFHLQGPPPPPTNLSASNDIYGQIKLTWTPPQETLDAPIGYKIYKGTVSGGETYYATTADDYWKWKDAAQGQTPGTFYYYVTSYNGSGESAPSNEVGPVSVVAPSAPAPRSLGVALNYSELNAADTVNNPTYDSLWLLYDEFLTARGVTYTTIYDADPNHPNIENDDIAGYSVLILGPHRNITSYTAQCIADYCKYSRGRVLACYVDSIANRKGIRQSDFALRDVYRVNASTAGSGGSPWVSDPKYRYLKPIGAPEAAVLFDGLMGPPGWDGAQQWNFNNYLVRAYTDGTASEVAKWYDSAGNQSIADPDDVGLVVGYTDATKTEVQSIYLGSNWWSQARGSFSACKLLENILTFLGVSWQPPSYTLTIGDVKTRANGSGVLLKGKVVTRQMLQQVYEPGPQTVRTNSVLYIEEPDRSGGIKVRMPENLSVTEGDVIDVAGQIAADQVQTSPTGQTPTYAAFERWITPIECRILSSGSVPSPLYVANKSVGGATQGSQIGVTGQVGLNNVGLLVKVVGRLTQDTQMDAAGNFYFLIDDGSGYQIPSEPVKGIKVIGFAPTSVLGSMIEVTGVIGAEYNVDHSQPPVPTNAVVPVIRMGAPDSARVID